jgi:predicted amidohydrolase YtcJ
MRLLSVGLAALLISSGAYYARHHAPAPDVLLVNAKVFTSDSVHPWAEAVAIRGDRIVAVGTTKAMRALAGSRSRAIDLGGRVVVPGFNDAHDHVSGGSPGTVVFDSTPTAERSVEHILDSLRAAGGRAPAGTWIRADLWPAALNDTSLRRAALDRVSPIHPVLLEMETGHGFVVNTAALRALGIRDSEPDPLGGWYERDAAGRLTGRLDEYAGWSAVRKFRALQPEGTIVANLQKFARRELRLGITSVQNMASAMDPARTVRLLGHAKLPLRVRILKFSIPSATNLNAGEWDGVPAHPAPRVVVSGRKWILDGSPIEGLAMTRRPYPGRPTWHGRLDFPVDSVRAMLAAALRTAEPFALHILGDSTAQVVLGLMESLASDSVWRARRVRFEHGGGLTPDQFGRAKAKGVVSVLNPQRVPPPPVSRSLPTVPLAAVVPPGLVIALGSDGEPRSPFVGMYYALSFPTEPRVPREAIVRWYTAGSAYAEFEERDKGLIAPGMLADLAVLSQDIFAVPLEDLPKTESVLTLVGGSIVWDAEVVR